MASLSSKEKRASFPNLNAALKKRNINLKGQLKLKVNSHFKQLKLEFERYFPDLDDTKLPIWKMTRNPFRVAEDIFPDNLQEEFLELKCNSTAKDDFEVMPLNDFWSKSCTYIRTLVVQRYGSYFRFCPLTSVKVDFLLRSM